MTMLADVPQTNLQEKSKLPLIFDGLSCVGALGGTLASLLTQQVMFATVPLSVMFAVQVINRHKQHLNLIAADQQSHLATQQLHSAFQTQEKAVHSLELDTSHHCINVFELERLIETKDQVQTYETDKLSLELRTKLRDLDTVVETLRAIVAESRGGEMSSAQVHYKRGVHQEQLGNLEAAIADYTRVLEQEATHAFAYLRRGLAYLELEQKQAALLDLNAAARHFFGEGDLPNYEIAKEKANAIHLADQAAQQVHLARVESTIPSSVNSMFGG